MRFHTSALGISFCDRLFVFLYAFLSCQFEAVDDIDDLEKRPSRKQKSLGLLCQKFLARYPSYPLSTEKTTISLDEAASSLGKILL